jgi:hypothetical protein
MELSGIWKIDTTDVKAMQMYGEVTLEFKSSGDLIYTVFHKGKVQKTFMTYTVKDNILVTYQATSSDKEETTFKILPDGRLEITAGKDISRYCKMDLEM